MREKGVFYEGNQACSFSVWAPEKEEMILHIVAPEDRKVKMVKDLDGYFNIRLSDVEPGTRYFFTPNSNDRPDPVSNFQPEGVHGPSEVVDHHAFKWNDIGWKGLPFKDLILYELHIGTFTDEGTFDAAIANLDDLVESGINGIELMPVNQFPGARNWGYDGTYIYAVQNSYGGPEGLKRFVDACHQKGIAVFLDVVYNHIGPEGNYLPEYGPYFTNKYCTPWGDAINFDNELSDHVKDYFSENIIFWFENYHLDGLRLDAVHMMYDNNADTFWDLANRKIKLAEQKEGRKLHLIAECDFNSPKIVKDPEVGGYGFDAQWLDDFHHSLYVLLDKKGKERYADFGTIEQLAKSYTDGFVHSGEYVKFRKRRHGASSVGIPGEKFVVFNLNHDQVGNRVGGERLSVLVDFERQKLAAAAMMLSPYVPMLFMGEEYGEDERFFYFVDHSDPDLIEAVRNGRKKEFEDFGAAKESFPDPQSVDTYNRSKLKWEKRTTGNYKILLDWHKKLIQLRKTDPILKVMDKNCIKIDLLNEEGLTMHRLSEDGRDHLLAFFNFSDEDIQCKMPSYKESWSQILNSRDSTWMPENQQSEGNIKEMKSGQMYILKACSICIFR